MSLTKTDEADAVQQLRTVAMEPHGRALRALVQRDYDRALARLVDAEGDSVLTTQGECRVLRKMLKYLTPL